MEIAERHIRKMQEQKYVPGILKLCQVFINLNVECEGICLELCEHLVQNTSRYQRIGLLVSVEIFLVDRTAIQWFCT